MCYHPAERIWMLNSVFPYSNLCLFQSKPQTVIKVIDRSQCLLFAILISSAAGFQATDFHRLQGMIKLETCLNTRGGVDISTGTSAVKSKRLIPVDASRQGPPRLEASE